jgi:Uma2 family endonuclease
MSMAWQPIAQAKPSTPVPPLQNGDRLSAEDYERRYDAMLDLKKAELINGVVYMGSPVTLDTHGGPHFDLIGWMGLYRMATPGVRGGDNAALRLALRNRPQPDGCLLILPGCGGQVRIDAKGYIVGGPELVAEVAATSENYDLHDKLEVYQANGVQEYVVWRVFDEAIDWFVLRKGRFERLPLTADGL